MPFPSSFKDLPLEAVIRAAHYDHHHRSVGSGGARAAVFGASDGLVSNTALILGVAAADPAPDVVLLAGVAGLLAGAFSMAVGEYVSMRAQAELYERELEVERQAQIDNPALETLELVKIYESRGIEPELAAELAEAVMEDPDLALEVHAREELGIDPDDLGSPYTAAGASFVAFGIGAILPLLPFFFASGGAAVLVAIGLAVVGAVALGALVGFFSGRSMLFCAARQLVLAAAAASVTYGIGSILGVNV